MHLNPAEYVIHVFKGARAAARAIGRHHSRVIRWSKPKEAGGSEGRIPGPVRMRILTKARELDLDITPQDLDFGRTIINEPYNGER